MAGGTLDLEDPILPVVDRADDRSLVGPCPVMVSVLPGKEDEFWTRSARRTCWRAGSWKRQQDGVERKGIAVGRIDGGAADWVGRHRVKCALPGGGVGDLGEGVGRDRRELRAADRERVAAAQLVDRQAVKTATP